MSIKSLLFAISLAVSAAFSINAWAVECPKDKVGKNPSSPITKVKGNINVYTHKMFDLENQAMNAKGWNMRARSILFDVGSAGPMHSHQNRPEFVMLKHGTLEIHDINCTVPIVLNEGDVFLAGRGDVHWGVNTSAQPAIVYIVDILNDKEL